MVLRLRERLLSGFLGVSLLVLLVGGAGVFLIDRVSEASNRILDEKIPLQSRAEFLLLSVEKTIALSRDYLLSLDADAAAEILNQIEIESASVDNLLQLLESDSIRTERDHVAEVYESLTAAVERLAEAHDQRVAYWFMFDGKEKDLKTFVLEQSVALNEWLNALEESVKFDVPFGGNLELSQNDYMRWYSEYETEDPALKKLLKKYAKVNNKIFKFANKVNRASGKKKLSHFQRGQSRQIIKARKGLNAIIKYITPVVDHALKAERVSMNEMNGIATEIELSIHALRMVIEQEVKAARQEVEETQKLAWVTLLSGSAIAVVLGILVALYIARSVVNPVNRLKRLMSEVSGRGDFSQRVENPTEDEVGETAVTLNTLLDSLQGAIGEIGEVMSASAEGDFSRRVESDLPGDLDRLKHSINGSVERTQEAISRVNGVMRAVEAGDFEQRIEEGFGGELHTFRNTVNGALDSLQQMTENLSLVMQAIINGNFNYRMTGAGGSEIERNVNRAMSSMETIIGSVAEVMKRTADGDLSQGIDGEHPGQLAVLTQSINHSLANQRKIVGNVRNSANMIRHGVGEIADGNSNLSQRTIEQAASLEKTATSMKEMASTVKMNAVNASQATQIAVEARNQAESGAAVVSDAVVAMGRINESSAKIAEIIILIDGIAFQTNLLALNAAVEAARAGDHGRGFAVVAGEVRTLAQRSADAAKDIKQLIEDSADRVKEGGELVEQSGEALQFIQGSVKKVNDIVSDIAAASEEQSRNVAQVNSSVAQLDVSNQQNSALVEEAAAASESMDEQAGELAQLVDLFQLGEDDQA